jgi:hypothetical protein
VTSAGGKSVPLRSRKSFVYDLLFRAAAETLIIVADPKSIGARASASPPSSTPRVRRTIS